jgi:hypothetical protein
VAACLAAALTALAGSPAAAAWMESELLQHGSREEAARTLRREQAVEQLAAFGLDRETAASLVDAALAHEAFPLQAVDGLHLDAAAVARLLEAAYGCSAAEAEALDAWLTPAELDWLRDQGAYAFSHAGRIVGINITGVLVLLLPILVAVIVAATAGQSAAPVALGALLAGVLFVLLVEPSFIFGERSVEGG